MFANLALGLALITLTAMVHMVGLIALSRVMVGLVSRFSLDRHPISKATAMILTVLGLFLVHTVEIWIWAAAYLALGTVQNFEEALYFSTATFSTVGYGDITLTAEWRLFGAMEGLNGFILIGWSTAYLISASTRHGPFRSGEHF